MEIGFVTSILDHSSFKEVVDTASRIGYQCIEVACWPNGTAERRYAGVCHIDVTNMTASYAKEILDYAESKNVRISALAYYPNPLDPDKDKQAATIEHLKKVILASKMLQVNMVTTFIGRNQYKNVEENLELVQETWPSIIHFAEENKVKIAIENCPMLFGPDQWPGGQNLMTTPEIWKKIFEMIPSPFFGLNFDPSHFIWQMMDYIEPISEFSDKIFHIHFKDIKLNRENLKKIGIMAYPLGYMDPRIPGRGDIDWQKFIEALDAIAYSGPACVEVENRDFEGSDEKVMDSLQRSYNYIKQFI